MKCKKWTLVEAYLLCEKGKLSSAKTGRNLASFHIYRKSQQRNGWLRKFSIGLGRLPSLNVKQFG